MIKISAIALLIIIISCVGMGFSLGYVFSSWLNNMSKEIEQKDLNEKADEM